MVSRLLVLLSPLGGVALVTTKVYEEFLLPLGPNSILR